VSPPLKKKKRKIPFPTFPFQKEKMKNGLLTNNPSMKIPFHSFNHHSTDDGNVLLVVSL
jgi:hypothetical protein